MKITNGNGKRALKCSHVNLGSGNIFNKFHQLETILCLKGPDVLGLSETILDPQSEALLLDMGLSVETKTDSERISVVIKDSVVYSRRLDLECQDMPAIWLEIGTGSSKFLIAHLYREWQMPPSTRRDVQYWTQDWRHQLIRWNKFVEVWESVMERDELEVHVMGDFNMDTNKWRQLGNKHDPKVQPCVDLLYEKIFSSGVVQTIHEDTRTGSSAGRVISSCLDLHFTNEPEKISSVLVEPSPSDHCYIQFNRSGKKEFTAPRFTRRRQWGRIDWKLAGEQFATLRQNGDLDVIYRTRDVDQVVDFTTKVIQKILDSQAKCKNINNRKNFCPFMDKELSDLVKIKKTKYKLWLATRNATTWLDYKRAKQNVKRV